MIGIVMAQVRPYTHLNIRQEFQVLACQAIVDGARRDDLKQNHTLPREEKKAVNTGP